MPKSGRIPEFLDRYPKMWLRPWSGEIIRGHGAQILGGGVKRPGITLMVLGWVLAAVITIALMWQGRH
jgi:hypothetical protein